MSPPLRRSITLSKPLLAVGGVLVGLMLAEVSLRAFDPFHYAEIEARERLGADILAVAAGRPRLIPGARAAYRDRLFVIDGNGLRHRDAPRAGSASPFRILVLGGSVPFGWGVGESESFPRLVERELNGDQDGHGGSVEVVNAAVPGYGLHWQLQHLEEIGRDLAPDLVLVPVMWSNVPSHSPRPPSRRFLSPRVRTQFRTMRLVEVVTRRFMGDGPAHDSWQPRDLDPRGLQDVRCGLGLFKQACDRLGAKLAVLDALGIDALRDTCAHLDVVRMCLETSTQWLERNRISDRDAHPNAKGHRQIADCVTRHLRSVIPR